MIPITQEPQSKPNTDIKTFALNPGLLGILAAIAASTNKTKVNNPSEKEFDIETQSELENTHEETIKGISEASGTELTSKITANLK